MKLVRVVSVFVVVLTVLSAIGFSDEQPKESGRSNLTVSEDFDSEVTGAIFRVVSFCPDCFPMLHLGLKGGVVENASGFGYIDSVEVSDGDKQFSIENLDYLKDVATPVTYGKHWNSTPFSKILKEGDGCQVRFFVGIPKGLSVMPATVSKVEGVAHLILVDEGSEVIVDDLESLIEKTIDHPVLKDGGFDLTMALKSFSLPKTLPVPLPEGDDGSRRELTIAWNSPDVTREEWQEMAAGTYPGIYSVQLIDQNGKLLLDQSGGYYGGKTATGKLERCEWSIGLDPKQDGLPQGVRLRIRLASKVSLVKFPFSFEDVPVFLNEKPKTP